MVLIFNNAEQCLVARQYLEKARLELLEKRVKLVAQVIATETGAGTEEGSKGEQTQPDPETETETEPPPVDAPDADAVEGEEGSGD